MSNPYYFAGCRDTIANLFMTIRNLGIEATLDVICEEYRKNIGKDNPHIEWYIEEKAELWTSKISHNTPETETYDDKRNIV